ncbi:alpha-1,2-mannosyltransferase ktr1 [Coemansia sp. RSA 455]|nr:alpha-1,2-mannosyltransferase ktr1 [Coemansia sp. S680]KAJ2116825.1 alpha-1,2-mannosyltransferase ktr1 [Coemansia sp. RSA 922]KAJ2255256.1 alpha-1,2-mannosyltransferase ktr1 [Coemansia sp. RSA 455]KAJ2461113.1 alpha-1,2-mannosyltransferase ktr1 [Coemansia sp. RSA 2337]
MAFPGSRYARLIWRHLPILLAGVLGGYIVGTNKTEIRRVIQDVDYPQLNSTESTLPVRAAIVALVRNSDLFGLRLAMRQIEDRFNSRYNYPYIFVNDVPFTEEFKQGVSDLTKAHIEFGTLDHDSWKVPEWIDQERYDQVKRTAKYPHGEKDSYRKMCRFQSGYLHRHPLLSDLEYYWRIEPDVEYFCDIDYDPFMFMKQNGLKYGWNIAMPEFMDTIRTLWNTTQQFIAENPKHLAKHNLKEWLVDDSGDYNGCHFWSNFEIVDLSFYRSPAYQAYFDYLDRAGGFFYERWGDAPVHSIAAALFLNASQVHYFDDIGYFHPQVYTCPAGSKQRGRCVCDADQSIVQNGFCNVRFRNTKHQILYPDSPTAAYTGPVLHALPQVASE